MLARSHWQEATEQVGVRVSESTAYRWVRNWRQDGEAGLSDGRQGHAYKMTPCPVTRCLQPGDWRSGDLGPTAPACGDGGGLTPGNCCGNFVTSDPVPGTLARYRRPGYFL